MSHQFAGIYTPIVTPFTASGDVDERAIVANVDRYLASPLTGLVVLGSNGEAAQLEEEEADRVIGAVRARVPNDRPVLVGTGRESTRGTIAACRRAADLGASAVMARTPSFYKPAMTSDVFIRHYTEVADASPVPLLLYNVTIYTGVNLLPDAVEKLSEHPNIVGLKDSGNDMLQIGDYLARAKPGFTVLAGAAPTLLTAAAMGVHGAVLALAGIVPELCVELFDHVKAGRVDDARTLQRRLLPLARAIGPVYGVAGLKAALDLMGLHGGTPRPPLRPVPTAVIEILRGQLAALGVLREAHAASH
ncbi:MAG TPA: dihydrodipicolinate synthase family protein [Vicinamibacterales bacterium]|nr:dihydrodipicolinate synthase family protein [Vicinamibacterales bacterium]